MSLLAVVYHILPILFVIGAMYLCYGLFGPRIN